MRKRSLLFASLALVGSAFAADPTPEQVQFFEGKIRPILTDKCYKCHAVETGKSKGGLALDSKEGLLKGGESGPGLKPGNPDSSLLIKAVLYSDKDLQMPPKGEKLSDHEIADLTAWVKMGAPDPRKAKGGKLSGLTDKAKLHWAFQPLKKVEIPTVKNRGWCFTQLDAFVMQKLEEKRMSPAPGLMESPARIGKPALLRRATYDLTGLPPTPDEIFAFMADQTPQAFSKVVDRLLASPQYGERWGRYWLDTARYSDTAGKDNRNEDYRFPYAWTYRDWVIKAMNDDLPYDQFIIQQLAADKIKGNPKENLAALGLQTVGERFPNINDIIDDRINTVSKGFLALTVTCARCHDHMFDPIPTKDYYALHGVFSSTMELPKDELPLLKAAIDPAQKADFDKKIVALEEANKAKYYTFIDKESSEVRAKIAPYLMNSFYRRNNMDAESLKKADTYATQNKLDIQLGNQLRRYLRNGDPMFGPFMRFADAKAADYKSIASGVASDSKINPLVSAAFKGATPTNLDEVAAVYGKLFASFDGKAKELLGKVKATASAADAALDKDQLALAFFPFKILTSMEVSTASLREELKRWPQQLQGRARFDFNKANELELTHEGAPMRAMAVMDRPEPKDSPVFVRGQQGVPGEIVQRRFLEMFANGKPEPFKDGSGRLELANAIASKSNPLTARVLVNRVWMHHFGQAFVRTPDDLGTQSEAPSHPEMLDYLAGWFMEQGWSMKKLHKIIMLSHVYQEDSAPDKSLKDKYAAIDPENRYLWRANIRRLDFESFRDSLLVMGGRIDKSVGGQPVNLTDEPYTYRRSVYGYIDRGNVPELLANFDFSRPDMPNSARTTTIVPQQALFLMNSPMVVDVARRVLLTNRFRTSGADFQRVTEIYLSLYQRYPTPLEIANAVKFISGEMKKQPDVLKEMSGGVAANQKKAETKSKNLAEQSNSMKPIQNEGEIIARSPLSSWETFAQALLFSNEAAYVN